MTASGTAPTPYLRRVRLARKNSASPVSACNRSTKRTDWPRSRLRNHCSGCLAGPLPLAPRNSRRSRRSQLPAHLGPGWLEVVVFDQLGVVGGYLGRLHLLARPHGRRGGEQGLRHAIRKIGPVLQRKLEHSHMRELLEAEQRDEVELLGFLEQLFSRLAQRADELALADHGLERLAQEIDRGIGVAGDCRSVLPDRGAGGKRQAI